MNLAMGILDSTDAIVTVGKAFADVYSSYPDARSRSGAWRRLQKAGLRLSNSNSCMPWRTPTKRPLESAMHCQRDGRRRQSGNSVDDAGRANLQSGLRTAARKLHLANARREELEVAVGLHRLPAATACPETRKTDERAEFPGERKKALKHNDKRWGKFATVFLPY